MESQLDLEGNETGVKKELVKKTTTKYTADVFTISVSEAGQDQLDRLHEEANIDGIRRWTAFHMKVINRDLLPLNEEGKAFQSDLDKFCEVL